MDLLVIDLDGTITKSDNLVGFSLFMLLKKYQLRFLLIFPLMVLLKLKLINNLKFKIWYAYLILKNLEVRILTTSALEYVKSGSFQNDINPDVIEFISKQINTVNLILSANFDFIAVTVAKSLKINDCASINLEQIDGTYTGLIKGVIPYGQGKVDVFRQFVSDKNYNRTIGIGDSQSDLSLLKHLDVGYLVKYNSKHKATFFTQVQK